MRDVDIEEAAGNKAIDTESESSNDDKVKDSLVINGMQICTIESEN